MTLRRTLPLAASCLILVTGTVRAQESQYAEHTDRRIKALSAEDIASLEAGVGMGLALAAELNGYPGPKHVLELADELELTAEQRRSTEALFQQMQSDAQRIGTDVIREEAALDSLFSQGVITEPALDQSVTRIAALQGELRTLHLGTHLTMRALLTEHQTVQYNQLRGYAGNEAHRHGR